MQNLLHGSGGMDMTLERRNDGMEDYDRKSDDEQLLTGTMERLRLEIERLIEAYGGNCAEVLEAYRQSEQAANRRAKRLEKQALQAKHEWQIANYELRLAKDLIEEIERRRTR
jgi:hypothetical protein